MALQLAKITVDSASQERRSVPRRTLSLGMTASAGSDAWRVVIQNLSETGLMMQTAFHLDVGDTLEVKILGSEEAVARVVWSRDRIYGCEFLSPITKGAVSAALLQSPIDQAASDLSFRGPDSFDQQQVPQQRPASQAAVMLTMLILLAAVALFIFALFALPFSSQQW